MQDVDVSVAVYGIDDKPLADVSVTAGTYEATTGSDGKLTFYEAGMVDGRAVIRFEKEGYFTLTRSAVVDDDGEINMHVMLCRKGTTPGASLQTEFDASSAQTLKTGEMTVVLPAGSVVRANGSAYSGKVRADMLYIAPGDKNAALMMPGGDLSTSENTTDILEPCGITDVVLADAAGQPLKIKENAGVEISFPAHASVTDASLPLWSFSEERGVWIEDGSLARQGNAYKGTVKHFSSKAPGKRQKKGVISVQVFVCDKARAGVRVIIGEGDFGDLADLVPYIGITNSAGNFQATVLAKKGHIVTAIYNDESQSQSVPANNSGRNSVVFNFEDFCDGYGVVEAYGNKYPLNECFVLIEGHDPDPKYDYINLYSINFRSHDIHSGTSSNTEVYIVVNAPANGTGVPSGTYHDSDMHVTEYTLNETLVTVPWGSIKDITMVVNGTNITITGVAAACRDCISPPPPTAIKLTWNGPITVEKAYE
ncbi:hypothetical protein FACS1894181_06220 [Bacteroidia bacterium]|nr:hypothetical protein FACS1894181_06220 [Bacteroidia bacterium]